MSDNNVNENTETMADALKSVTTVKIGDTVKADVLAVEDKQLIVGIEGTGVEGVVTENFIAAILDVIVCVD